MALTNISIMKYNNYYNRIVKQPSNSQWLNSYLTEVGLNHKEFTQINFAKNDGINCQLVLTTYDNGIDYSGVDYLVEYHYDGTIQKDVIDSRWFIIDTNNIRAGQQQFTLRRDLIVDNYDQVIDAPAYIEKATVQNINDVAIYNQEELELNEIKTYEWEIVDESMCSWVVAYFNQNKNDQGVETDWDINDIKIQVNTPDYQVTNISSISQFDGTNPYILYDTSRMDVQTVLRCNSQPPKYFNFRTMQPLYAGPSQTPQFGPAKPRLVYAPLASSQSIEDTYYEAKESILTAFQSSHTNFFTEDNITKYNNKYVKDTTTNKIYYVKVNMVGNSGFVLGPESNTGLTTAIENILLTNSAVSVNTEDGAETSVQTRVAFTQATKWAVSITEVPTSYKQVRVQIGTTTRLLKDAPYKLLAIPVGSVKINGTNVNLILSEALSIATQMAAKMGNFCYDVQLLPYCPTPAYFVGSREGEIPFSINPPIIDTINISSNTGTAESPVWVVYAKGIIGYQSSVSNTVWPDGYDDSSVRDVETAKIENQCEKYRLCSPNYAASFDFNKTKIGYTGFKLEFIADSTYKPYNPYIHIRPKWGDLYGSNYEDARGLICKGDFSIPQINEAWTQYQISNKNYLNAFNREVDSIEINNKMAKVQDVVGAATGALSGAVSGAMTGAAGGAGVAAAAGLVGGAISAVGGIADVAINDMLRNEALDLKQDQFNMSIANIKAQPNTIAKVSTFDANNRIWPMLEYYCCTEDEKQIFKDKMKYNGMTINRIGKISDFLSNTEQYIKCKLIRLENVYESFKVVNSIADELNKGIYIKEK